MEVKGEQFGARVIPQSDDSSLIEILSEDDGEWFETGISFDAAWLGDMIAVMISIKSLIDARKT